MRITPRNSYHEGMVNIIKNIIWSNSGPNTTAGFALLKMRLFFKGVSQPAFTCSNPTLETVEQYLNFFKDNN